MISFVILHYKNINDTVECIKSIKIVEKNPQIIVVDNNSLSLEEESILKKYKIELIKLDKNYGFAKANNIGCRHAIDKYKPEFICVINNDTIIKQKDFIKEIERMYKEYQFDALGPKIICDGDSVNPFPVYDSLDKIKKKKEKVEKLIKIYRVPVIGNFFDLFIDFKIKFINKPKKAKNGTRIEKNVALHGCAIIFSKKYYQKFKDIFYNETFLYHEEEFLYYRMKQSNLRYIYDPNLTIIHKEGSALNKAYSNERKKKLFKYKEINKSLEKLIVLIENNEKI